MSETITLPGIPVSIIDVNGKFCIMAGCNVVATAKRVGGNLITQSHYPPLTAITAKSFKMLCKKLTPVINAYVVNFFMNLPDFKPELQGTENMPKIVN